MKTILTTAFLSLAVISASSHAAGVPQCTVSFEKEEPVLAKVEDLPNGSRVLVAESTGWAHGLGARVEVQFLVSDDRDRVPMTVYLRSTKIQTIEAGGNTIQVPVVGPLSRRRYWFNPQEGRQIVGPVDEPIAFVKCEKSKE